MYKSYFFCTQNDTSGKIGVSSLIDTWIVVRELDEEVSKKRIRGLFIIKSRGKGHDSNVHKLILSDDGIKLMPMRKRRLVKMFLRVKN